MDTALRFISYIPSSDIDYPQRVIRVFPLQELHPQKEYTHGRICVYLDIQFSEGLDLYIPFDELIEELVSNYYESQCTNVYEHLLDNVNVFRDTLIVQISQHGVPLDHVVVSACVCVVWGQILYAASFGEMTLALSRGGHSGEILKTLSLQELDLVSGFLEINDVVAIKHPAYPMDEIFAHPPTEDEGDEGGFFEGFVREHAKEGSFYSFKVTGILVPSYEEERIVVGTEQGEEEVFEVEEDRMTDAMAVLYDSDQEEKLLEAKAGLRTRSGVVIMSFFSNLFSEVFRLVCSVFAPVLQFFTHKRLVLLGSMVMLLFVGFVFFGKEYEKIWDSELAALEEKKRVLPELELQFSNAQDSLERNLIRAQKALADLKVKVETLSDGVKGDPEIVDLKQRVDEAYSKATRTYEIAGIETFYDMSSVSPGATGSKMSLFGDALYVAELKQSVVYRIDAQTRAARILLGGEDMGQSLVDVFGDANGVYALSNGGIFTLGKMDSEVKKLAKAFEGWGKVGDLEVFGGNLYVLDTEKSQIWKYNSNDGLYGFPNNYLAAGASYDLKAATDMVIDGYIWVGLSYGRVLKFASGTVASFTLETLAEPIQSLRSIFVDAELPYMLVLDDVGGRLVVYSKETGGYIAQYLHKELKMSNDFVYDPESRKVIVLKGSMLYSFFLPSWE